jgi:surface polysaccharide O-acyltransferase-like enzyme
MYHLWFFYAIIGLYAFVPVLRKFHQHGTAAEKLWFIAIWLLVSSIEPFLHSVHEWIRCPTLPLCRPQVSWYFMRDTYGFLNLGGYAGFMLLGAMLVNCKGNLKSGLMVALVASLLTMSLTYFRSVAEGAPSQVFYAYTSPFVVLGAVGVFVAFMGFDHGPSPKILRTLADSTLGIYGLHAFIIDPLAVRKGFIAPTGTPWIDPLLAALCVFTICLVLVATARLLKPIRWIIG